MINMKEIVNTSMVVTKELLTKKINWLILTLWLTQSNHWVETDHAARIQYSPNDQKYSPND